MNLLRAASTVSLLTLASRITGLVREQAMAAVFGAGVTTDAFNVAFRLPNLLRRMFAEGAFSQAFVPLLAESRARQGDEATHRLIDAVGTVLLWVMLAVSAAGVIGAPLLVWLAGSGLKEHGGFDLAVVMTRWMFPYIGCVSMVALAAGILNTWRRFAVSAATPVLMNVASIASIWWLAPWFGRIGITPVYALAIGVMIGGLLQMAIQVPALAHLGLMPKIGFTVGRLRDAWHHEGVRRVLRQMGPAMLGVSVAQISLIINTQIATHIGTGAVSWLTYADRLMEFPTALLGVALGVVLLPQLSARRASGDHAGYSALLDWGLRLVMLLSLPCAVALIVFPEPLVAVLYHRGRFGAEDVLQTVHALMGWGVGLVGLVALKVVAPGFYAQQDVRTPMRVAIVVLVFTQLVNLVSVPLLGQAGLSLSVGLGAMVNAGWLIWGLRQRGSYRPAAGWPRFLLRVAIAAAVMGVALAVAAQRLDWLALGAHEMLRAAWLGAVLAGAALLYFAALFALGMRRRHFVRQS